MSPTRRAHHDHNTDHDHDSFPCHTCRKRHVRPDRATSAGNAGSVGRIGRVGSSAVRLKPIISTSTALTVLALASVSFLSANPVDILVHASASNVLEVPFSVRGGPDQLKTRDEKPGLRPLPYFKGGGRLMEEGGGEGGGGLFDVNEDVEAEGGESGEGLDDHDHSSNVESDSVEADHDGHDVMDHNESSGGTELDETFEDHDGYDHLYHSELETVEDGHDEHDSSAFVKEDEIVSIASSFQEETMIKPWGQVIGATLIVNLASLSGVLLVIIPAIYRGFLKLKGVDPASHDRGKFVDVCIPAFAVGALMATSVFLVFPEALHLIEGGHEVAGEGDHSEEDQSAHNHRDLQEEEEHTGESGSSESLNAAKFGMAVLGGFLLPLFLSIFVPHPEIAKSCENVPGSRTSDAVEAAVGETRADQLTLDGDGEGCESCAGEKMEADVCVKMVNEGDGATSTANDPQDRTGSCEEEEDADVLPRKVKYDYQLGASVLIGDAFHNFADGLFIGAAFLSCSWGTAMSIAVVTLFHEIAQELADFILLTRYVGLTVFKACLLNFISGLSVTLGGVVVLAGNPTPEAVGVILAMAGGVYVNIAATETIPRLDDLVKTKGDRVLTLFSIIVGTVPIGLVLLNHEHCG